MVERRLLCSAFSAAVGLATLHRLPFADDNALLQLVRLHKPALFYAVKGAYLTMLFTTPYIAASVLMSVGFIFWRRPASTAGAPALPGYPDPAARESLYLVVGELHQAKRPAPVTCPRWLVIPHRGLYTGIAIFGAIGSGKTSGCMYPFAEQLLAYQASDRSRRIGGLVLEVKGSFCHNVRAILEKHGRADDYLEVSLTSSYRYNPLYSDLDAYALAYGIATLLNSLFGKGREPFWQQAYTNLVKFIILLHKVLYDYVTLFDIYEGAINPEALEKKIKEGEWLSETQQVVIDMDTFLAHKDLESYPFESDPTVGRMKAPFTEALRRTLDELGLDYELATGSDRPGGNRPAWSDDKRQQFESVKRWFYEDWLRIEPRLRTSIVEGISVFLSLFDDNPVVKRMFCPPKETYDPVANPDGRYGRPLPPFATLIEQGAVCALNFPVATNPSLARVIGALMKQDFQSAVLSRIPMIERQPDRTWREVLFLCDEYHAFATSGESDPSGDEKFFALSRQARCIPIVATQSISSLRSVLPGESWRTLLQTFRTKVFLSLSDDFSADTASRLCGKEAVLTPSYSFGENGQDAGVSMLTGQAASHRATLSTSKSYSTHILPIFEPKVFTELKNAQSIVLAYDGTNPWPATYCYLKPHYLDPNVSYFEQLARGEL